MKKIYLIVLLLCLGFFPDCKKASTAVTNVCATCKEAHSGYTAADYCGTSADVDTYIKTLYDQGAQAGQSWSCTKH